MWPPLHHPEENTKTTYKRKRILPPVRGRGPLHFRGPKDHRRRDGLAALPAGVAEFLDAFWIFSSFRGRTDSLYLAKYIAAFDLNAVCFQLVKNHEIWICISIHVQFAWIKHEKVVEEKATIK
jgi:hypothetical protein